MSLFRKKCAYCGEKIEKGNELFKDVKDPAFVGTRKKAFCCSEHAKDYEESLSKSCCGSGGSCCG
jgi:hypothetical protein